MRYLRFYHNGFEFVGLVDDGSQWSLSARELRTRISRTPVKGEKALKFLEGEGEAGLGIQDWVEVKATLEKTIGRFITFGMPSMGNYIRITIS